jgi:TIR domain
MLIKRMARQAREPSMHVFISYSHANGDFAEILKTRLERSGFNVWTDEDRLLAGEDWRNG